MRCWRCPRRAPPSPTWAIVVSIRSCRLYQCRLTVSISWLAAPASRFAAVGEQDRRAIGGVQDEDAIARRQQWRFRRNPTSSERIALM